MKGLFAFAAAMIAAGCLVQSPARAASPFAAGLASLSAGSLSVTSDIWDFVKGMEAAKSTTTFASMTLGQSAGTVTVADAGSDTVTITYHAHTTGALSGTVDGNSLIFTDKYGGDKVTVILYLSGGHLFATAEFNDKEPGRTEYDSVGNAVAADVCKCFGGGGGTPFLKCTSKDCDNNEGCRSDSITNVTSGYCNWRTL